ncbi:hypothetical protein CspHIS471_0101920 [Cutaneotrichosporon sp. HIS471]|nr:hypothetical protein CspHIS471_0101920 [Cutaneotrichosporon sp. HIS471]
MSERTPLLGHRRRAPPVYAYPAVIAVLLLLLFPILLITHNLPNTNEAIWIRNLGAYAPLVPHRAPPLPDGCSVDQVSILHRHTARYPTPGAAVRLRKTLAKLVNATDSFFRTTDLTMKGWEFGELTQPGREAARASGLDFRDYALPPFIRSSGGRRVLDSAHLFLSSLGRGNVDVIIPEGESAGWVNELVARLTDSAVVDGTCTNRTLDANPATFPLGQRLFIDFTHDNEMVAIQAALGINRRVPIQGSVPLREWVLSEIVPFGARWRFERVVCGPQRERFIRMLINDRVMPVERPECGGTLCPLDAFVASQKESRERDWAICVRDVMEKSNQDAYTWML